MYYRRFFSLRVAWLVVHSLSISLKTSVCGAPNLGTVRNGEDLTFHAYYKISSDYDKYVDFLSILLSEVSESGVPFDADNLLTEFGINRLDSMEISSKSQSLGFNNTLKFQLLNRPPTLGSGSIFQVFGVKPAALIAPSKAPFDADVVVEANLDLGQLYQTASSVFESLRTNESGFESLDEMLESERIFGSDVSLKDLVQLNEAKVFGYMFTPDSSESKDPIEWLVCLDNAGSLFSRFGGSGGKKVVSSVVRGLEAECLEESKPSLWVGRRGVESMLFFSDSPETIEGFFTAETTLVNSLNLRRLIQGHAFKANAFVYLSGDAINFSRNAQRKMVHGFFPDIERDSHASDLLALNHSAIGMASFLERNLNSLEVQTYGPLSCSQSFISNLSKLLLNGYGQSRRVRQTAQRKAVLNNLRQIAAAADQYFLDTGKTKVRVHDLVGADKYIRKLEPRSGETYDFEVSVTDETLKVILSDGHVVEYEL